MLSSGKLRIERLEDRWVLNAGPLISEFMASNDATLSDGDGASSDWIEIHNPTSSAIDLIGWHLTDDPGQPTKWSFPTRTLAADGYLILFASSPGSDDYVDPSGFLHTNFALRAGGEYLALADPTGLVVQEFAPEFPPQSTDVSYGLDEQGLGVYFENATPGAANDLTSALSRKVLVSEIMYHPASKNDLDEYIELYNGEAAAVNLAGWSIAGGVDYEMSSLVLQPGEYLVVAADVATFQAKYDGGHNVVGGWQGKLANSGDLIELRDALGRPVDRVRYSDEGAWAQREEGPLDRGHRGWTWSDAHDGGGSSLELVALGLSNAWGQNWAASAVVDGTPGAANSTADPDGDAAPLVLDVTHLPVIPSSVDPVVVTARLVDELTTGLSATVHWRVDGDVEFTLLAMADDGGGDDAIAGDRVFTATLPPLPDGAVVEFFVESEDANGNARTYAGPTQPSSQQLTNLLFQVDDQFDPASLPGPDDMPIYRLIMTEAERAELEEIGSTRPDSFSHARMNGSLAIVSDQGVEVRYLVGIRNRGAGSSSRLPNSYHIDLARDDPWRGVEALNFNTQFTHLQLAGLRLFQAAGLIAEDTAPVRVLVNGVDLTDEGPPSFGVYVQLEAADGRLVAKHFPEDAGGNLYRVAPDSGRRWGDLRDLGNDPAAYVPFYEKKTNAAEADYSDLIELVDVLNNSPDAEYYQRLSQVVDVDQWLGYFAISAILANRETSLARGSGDDYFLYRGVDDPRFLLIPHDMDTIFGQGDTASLPTSGIYEAADIPTLQRLLTHAQIAPAYHAKLKSLLETTFSRATLDPFLEELLGDFTPADRIADMQSFMDARRQFILETIDAPLTAAASLPTMGGFFHTTEGAVALHGTAPLAGTRSVLVNGALASWNAAEGQWSLGQSTGGEIATLIVSGDLWQYLDAGRTPSTAPGADWRVDDPGWTDVGPSQLGYGDGDEQHVVEFIDVDPDQSGVQKNITTYFRKSFQVDAANQFVSLTMRILRDDGAVIYVNGHEAARPNMPDGAIGPDTEAFSSVSGAEEDRFFEFAVDPGFLQEGENVVAVEVHQDSDSSSDISFDLELAGVVGDPTTFSGLPLHPGINRILVEALEDVGGAGDLIDSTYVDVWYDAGATTPLSGTITTDQTLTAAGGPYLVTSDLTVAGGALTIEPGVTIYFNPGAGLTVRDGGRIVAEGNAGARIRLTHNPNLGIGQWEGIALIDTAEDNRFAYVDMQSGDGAGQAMLVDHATALLDHVEWLDVNNQVLDLIHPSLEVRDSLIPGISGDETIHLSGLDQGEWLIFDGNVVGFNSSGNDVVDLGHDTLTPPPIVFRNNVFLGGRDDGIDTDGFLVLIENNVFQNFHLGTTRSTTSNAVSTGHVNVGGQTLSSILTLRGNTFFDNDHDLLLKDFSSADLQFNTMVGATIGSIHFTEEGGTNVIGPGLGAAIDGNIFSGAAAVLLDVQPSFQLTIDRSIVPSSLVGLGVGNLDGDPLLIDPAGGDFRLGRDSPALGAGPGGADVGAVQMPRYEPASAANLRITELHYHPLAGNKSNFEVGAASDLFEFVELRNVGDQTIDLSNVAFIEGIDLKFPWQSTLAAGEYGVVVKNSDVFRSRYSNDALILGEYDGRFSNGGEELSLVAAGGGVIAQFAYNDASGWPQAADGAGQSLVVVNTEGDYNSAVNYRASYASGGSPGADEPNVLPADFDFSAVVDGADFLAWQRGFGLGPPGATRSDGDADADGDVDQTDERIWEASFGSEAMFGAAAASAESLQTSPAGAPTPNKAQPILSQRRSSPAAVDAAIIAALNEQLASRRSFSLGGDDQDRAADFDAAIESGLAPPTRLRGRRTFAASTRSMAPPGQGTLPVARSEQDALTDAEEHEEIRNLVSVVLGADEGESPPLRFLL